MKFQTKIIFPEWKVRNSNSHYIKNLNENFLFNFKDGGILKDNHENYISI